MMRMSQLLFVAVMAAASLPGLSSTVLADEKTCTERVYDAERSRGTEHREARERARDVCRDAKKD